MATPKANCPWITALDIYLEFDRRLDPQIRDGNDKPIPLREHHSPLMRSLGYILCRHGVRQYAKWLVKVDDLSNGYVEYIGDRGPAPVDQLPDVEMAALSAVIEWLTPAPQFPRAATDNQKSKLLQLRRDLKRQAQARLTQLDESHGVPWSGRDWDDLRGIPKKLLEYMHNRRCANLEDVFPVVWEREFNAGRADITGAIHKANKFLEKRSWHERLKKVRSESKIHWVGDPR
jgi:hypothetical protein